MRPVHSFRIPADHPALPGHFPGRPIVPGVILLDEALAALGLTPPLRLARVKLTAPVRPEETVTVLAGEPREGALAFACMVGERQVLSAVAVRGPT